MTYERSLMHNLQMKIHQFKEISESHFKLYTHLLVNLLFKVDCSQYPRHETASF